MKFMNESAKTDKGWPGFDIFYDMIEIFFLKIKLSSVSLRARSTFSRSSGSSSTCAISEKRDVLRGRDGCRGSAGSMRRASGIMPKWSKLSCKNWILCLLKTDASVFEESVKEFFWLERLSLVLPRD